MRGLDVSAILRITEAISGPASNETVWTLG